MLEWNKRAHSSTHAPIGQEDVCAFEQMTDLLRSIVGDQEITITSFVREFQGPDAHIECSMVDKAGKTVSRCLMIAAYPNRIAGTG